MSKIVKSISWTSPKGADIEVKIEISKSLESDISYSDGWNVDLGNKVVESKVITVYIDGKLRKNIQQSINRWREFVTHLNTLKR